MKPYDQLLELFTIHLNKHLDGIKDKQPPELYEPEAYILSLGGKRIRPLLALIACDLFDKDPSLALDAALTVELFHNFSLIHDDILDAAPLRRNKETVHIKWNQNIALLSGDVMLVKAFQTLQSYPNETLCSLLNLFSKTAVEVCEGQQNDMNFEIQTTTSVESYIQMITNKTAVLLGCSLQMGAIAAGAHTNDQSALYDFGKHLGISFQLLDDLLDAFAPDAEKFGKQVGGDILANKKTFLHLKALELANEKQKQELKLLEKEKISSVKIEKTLDLFRELTIQKHCQMEADKHTQLAIASLKKIDANASKKADLQMFAEALLQREI